MSDRNENSHLVQNDSSELDLDDDKDGELGFIGNPTPPPDVDLDKLRGDRIGDTVYSGKWCIQTVMKLLQSNVVVKTGPAGDGEEKSDVLDMDEELQNEVGALWDMTINVDVCLYLHSVGAVESICCVITSSRCPRATEMCVGMLANIITHSEMWNILSADTSIFNTLIQLLTNIDQPILLQVTRFFNTALCHVDNVQCYASLCECSSLVTQELLRILSGSTNGDLLKQAAELTYTLMSLDETDTNFCPLFADVDFVSSLLEASKELGYDHESSGQNYVMDAFNYFTTYKKGVVAIESMMEQIAEATTDYLKILCQNLNLYNNSRIITTMIATLNHIFSRSVIVRVGLMSSPSFIHSVLKTLVAVYRKLGFYDAIAYPKGRNKTNSPKISPGWKMEEDVSIHNKSTDTGSWSERATVSLSVSTSFQTPDASPIHTQQNRELEVSWSERRMSSPLVDDVTEEKWKRPKGKKILKRKDSLKGSRKYDSDGGNIKVQEVSFSGSGSQGLSSDSDEQPQKDSSLEAESLSLEEQTDRPDSQKSPNEGICALKLNHEERFHHSERARKSEEFTPQELFEEMDNDRNENEFMGFDTYNGKEMPQLVADGDRFRRTGRNNAAVIPAHSSKEDCIDKSVNHCTEPNDESSALANAENSTDSKENTDTPCKTASQLAGTNSNSQHDFQNYASSEDSNDGFHEFDQEDIVSSSDGLNGDKYSKLLVVISDFLADYFSNLRETIARDDGRPYLQDVMHYFNTRCSSVEIRAIVKCVGTNTDISQPLGRLLHMCDHFRAKRMKSVLVDFISKQS